MQFTPLYYFVSLASVASAFGAGASVFGASALGASLGLEAAFFAALA
jgi:hypothetical protein